MIYSSTGAQLLAPVTIPTHDALTGGIPTGQVFNSTTDFTLENGNPAKFIFAGIDGVISGWNGGTAAIKMADQNGSAVYTGLAIAASGTSNFLYAANFQAAKIDVFDKNFGLQTMSFTDPNLPAGYAPFNIQALGGQLYIMYARPDPVTHTEQKGPGLGYVDVFNTDGSFVKRFVSEAELNAPWGIAQAPAGWTDSTSTTAAILIGNFGDGKIHAYDASGKFLSTLKSNGADVSVEGLWGISFAPATATAVDPGWLFFAAGPGGETQGLYGYLKNN